MDKPVKVWTLDTETRGLFGGIFRIGLYDGDNYYCADTFDELYPVLANSDLFNDNHVYIHNLDFDVAKLAPNIFNKETIDFKKSLFINGSITSLKAETFTLHDSLKLLPSSLDKLSDDFGLTTTHKMHIDDYIVERGWAVYDKDGNYDEKESKGKFFELVEPDDPILNEYLKLDCIALYDILTEVSRLSELDFDTLVYCPTTASLSMKVYSTLYNKEYKRAVYTKFVGKWGSFIEDFIRQSYYGGRTEVFKPIMGNGFHYDNNSLYPFVMKSFEFPVGIPKFIQDDKAETMYKYWKITGRGMGFLEGKVYVPESLYIPPLPYRARGKLMFPTGKLQGVWCFAELEQAERMGCIIEEYSQCVYFEKTAAIFKDFVQQFEDIKMNSVGAKRTFAKLIQNSLYGKFGMQRQRTTFVNVDDIDELEKDGKEYVTHRYNCNLMNVDFVETSIISKAEYIQPQIASTVTAYARLILLEALLEQQEQGEIYYCDTDSVACLTKMKDKYIHDKDYGKWKLESVIEQGVFLQPKFYAEKQTNGKVTIRSKGIPKEIQKTLTFEDFEKWLSDFQKAEEDKIIIFENLPSRQKFLTSLKKNTDFDYAVMQHKTIKLQAEQKRIINYNENKTAPHNLVTYGDNVTDEADTIERLDIDDDKSLLDDFVELYGKIKTITKKGNDPDVYLLYRMMDKKTKERLFSKDSSVSIYDVSTITGLDFNDILEELVYSL